MTPTAARVIYPELTEVIGTLCHRLQKTLAENIAKEKSLNSGVVTVMAPVEPPPKPRSESVPSYISGANKILSEAVETAVIDRDLALKRAKKLDAELAIARANEEKAVNKARNLDRDLAALRSFTSMPPRTSTGYVKPASPRYKFW